jgi:hypothetical protein
LFVHKPLPSGRDFRSTPARFQPFLVKACGTAVKMTLSLRGFFARFRQG